jgi:hypothetical protein
MTPHANRDAVSATPAELEVDNPLIAEAKLTTELTGQLAELAALELALVKSSVLVPAEDSFFAGLRLSMAQIALEIVHQQLEWLGLQRDGQLEDDAFVLTLDSGDALVAESFDSLVGTVEHLVGKLAGLRVVRRVPGGETPA